MCLLARERERERERERARQDLCRLDLSLQQQLLHLDQARAVASLVVDVDVVEVTSLSTVNTSNKVIGA